MMDQIANVLLYIILGVPVAFLVYVAVWQPKEPMKGHAGRGCKCCNKK